MNLITPETLIADIVEQYPNVVEYLIEEYDFYCISCYMSEFETLEEGCRVHDIEGKYFQELLTQVNSIAKNEIPN